MSNTNQYLPPTARSEDLIMHAHRQTNYFAGRKFGLFPLFMKHDRYLLRPLLNIAQSVNRNNRSGFFQTKYSQNQRF